MLLLVHGAPINLVLFGMIQAATVPFNLSEETVTGTENHLLLEENFDSYETGEFPTNWTSHVNSGSQSFKIVKDASSQDGKLVYDGSASGHSAAALAPVQMG